MLNLREFDFSIERFKKGLKPNTNAQFTGI